MNEKLKSWFFTLLGGKKCVQINARTSNEARETMFKYYGKEWGFQYDSLEDVHPNDRDIKEVLIAE